MLGRDSHNKIDKAYPDTADAYELINTYNQISVHQLALEVPIRPAYSPSISTSFFSYIDICFAYQVTDHFEAQGISQKKLIFFGFPLRVVLTKTTNSKQIHDSIWSAVQRLIQKNSRSTYGCTDTDRFAVKNEERDMEEVEKEVEDRPYDVVIGNNYGNKVV